MLKAPRRVIAEGAADLVLRELNITALPVDPIAIAECKDILVQPKTSSDGFSGVLARVGDTFGIMYATHIESEGFQRFSVAHELGHYCLPGHPEHVLRTGRHESHANFASADPYEQEADMFAAALLMPERLFRKVMNRQDEGLSAIQGLAKACKTSLTAAAIRYARFTEAAVAVVQSTNGVVDFCTFSDGLKTSKVRWLKRGSPIPSASVTAQMARDGTKVLRAAEESGTIDLCEWFECLQSHLVVEEALGLGSYGKILTVITSDRLTKQVNPETDDEDDDDLVERWTPRFRR